MTTNARHHAKKRSAASADSLNLALCVLRGLLVAAAVTLVCVLGFALALKLWDWEDSVLAPVNLGIKLLSLLAGGWLSARRFPARAWVKGALVGLAYMLLGYAVYAIGTQSFRWAGPMATDALMGLAAGAAGAVGGANLLRRKE